MEASARFWLWTGVALVVAIVIRIWFLHAYSPADLPFADGLWYHGAANLLAEGKGFIDPLDYSFGSAVRESAQHPPLFVIVLGGVSYLGGTSSLAHQYAEIALDVAAVAMMALLGREIAGARVGVIAAFVAALSPRFWATEGEVLSESLYAVVVAGMLLTAYQFLRAPSWRRAAVLGLMVGLVAMTRGEGLLFLLVLVIPLVVRARDADSSRPILFGAAIAGTVLVIAPWTIYNTTRFENFVPVTTGLGTVVAGANCETSYSGELMGYWDVECAARDDFKGDESEESATLTRAGFDYARDHLSRVPVVVAARLGRMVELYDIDPATFGPTWVQALMLGWWYAGVFVAIAGAVILRRRGVSLLPLGATLVAVVGNAVLTWGTPRFRVPLDISMVVLVAVAIDAFVRRRTDRADHASTVTAAGELSQVG